MPPVIPRDAHGGRRDVHGPARSTEQALLDLEHHWIRLRLVGWAFTALWPTLTLFAEFMPIDLQSKALRVTGQLFGLVGLFLVAYGFWRVTETAHRRTHLH